LDPFTKAKPRLREEQHTRRKEEEEEEEEGGPPNNNEGFFLLPTFRIPNISPHQSNREKGMIDRYLGVGR